jgi:3-phosphoshikimate 1-carboxyvinyltransferase
MKRYRVQPSGPLRGQVRVPGDKSIGHRSLMFAGLAEGTSVLRGLSGGLDNRSTADALQAMGVRFEWASDRVTVHGVGLHGLRMPHHEIDCGNSGTTMRLFAGLLSAQRFGTTLVGDESLTRRPMLRVVQPLRARGAHIGGASGKKPDEVYPPLRIAPLLEEEALRGLEYDMPVASAQVKSALLLSGLYASAATAIKEPVLSRDHTERMLVALGVPLHTMGSMCVLDPLGWNRRWDPFEWEIPGDFSSAAFILAAAQMVRGSEVVIEAVGTNPTRTGLLDTLRSMQAQVHYWPRASMAGAEPTADLVSHASSLSGCKTGGELVTRMIDEIPVLSAIAAVSHGKTWIRDAKELRVKESDRIATMAEVLRAFGVSCSEFEDGLEIVGAGLGQATAGGLLQPAHVRSRGDHRIAMSAVLLGLVADGETWVDDVDCVDTSFPGFASMLGSLGANIVEETVPE